jgi:CDP-diacylglycerol---serine O-phosphatidyltransferase
MTTPPPDGSRDRRIEDPSNRWLIHPLAQALVPWAMKVRLSANAVSLIGLACGLGAALAYTRWTDPRLVILGLLLTIAWLVADGLDGKLARATGTASPFGRFLDGVCDHLIFVAIYIGLAWSIGTAQAFALALMAGVAHAVQSALYEGERYRFHRRVKGEALVVAPAPSPNPLVRLYDAVDAALADAPDPARFAAAYGDAATSPMRLLTLLSANMRVLAIFLACLAASPQLFWWFEIVPLTAVAAAGLVWHRRVEQRFITASRPATADRSHLTA